MLLGDERALADHEGDAPLLVDEVGGRLAEHARLGREGERVGDHQDRSARALRRLVDQAKEGARVGGSVVPKAGAEHVLQVARLQH